MSVFCHFNENHAMLEYLLLHKKGEREFLRGMFKRKKRIFKSENIHDEKFTSVSE